MVLKRPKKRLLKAKEEEREAFVLRYNQIQEEAQRRGAKIFFADEAHFRADADLQSLNRLEVPPRPQRESTGATEVCGAKSA